MKMEQRKWILKYKNLPDLQIRYVTKMETQNRHSRVSALDAGVGQNKGTAALGSQELVS